MSSSRDRILELFRQSPGQFVSGEEICRSLGVSRTAIWKQIGQLRELGYTVEAVRSRGYRLLSPPDRLLPGEVSRGLDTRRIGREVVYFEITDSTNAQARRLAEEGAPEGTVVIADQQTAGRGRLGRFWLSPPGVNLYLSIILRPSFPPRDATSMTFLSAVAVANAVVAVGPFTPQLKWPNDVLLDGRKVAGLLNEMNAETEQVHYLVLGVGVNLNMAATEFPSDLRTPATSLFAAGGVEVSRRDFTQTLLRQLDALYEQYLRQGFAPIRAAWEQHCNMVGRMVEVDSPPKRYVGCVSGIDESGALLVDLPGGVRERVLAGDVRLLS
jgi:BirA family biotin operon repressor/biotin-[acetyl-CoA-carboxylase] ligase